MHAHIQGPQHVQTPTPGASVAGVSRVPGYTPILGSTRPIGSCGHEAAQVWQAGQLGMGEHDSGGAHLPQDALGGGSGQTNLWSVHALPVPQTSCSVNTMQPPSSRGDPAWPLPHAPVPGTLREEGRREGGRGDQGH